VLQPQTGVPFVGRDHELGELLVALAEAGSGRGHVILLGGEPGIGKSRLADELASNARSRGNLVLWGRGWEDAGAPPYWPWVQALRVYLRSAPADVVRRHMGAGAVEIAQMLPELRVMYPDLPPPPDSESESARFQLFDSTTELLRRAATDRPMVVVLDDLHAADTPSILLLRFLATQVSDMALLIVGAYRDIELTPDHPLTSAISDMARERTTRVITLSGLGAEAVAEFIGATADVAPHDQLVAAVWRETSGNPLFVGEAVRLLSAEGRLTEVGDLTSLRVAVPTGVRAVIARRIGHLSKETGRALVLGAALGPEFSLDILRRVGDLDADDALDAVDEAVSAGLLVPVAGVLGRYRFSHDLIRETLYDELSMGRRIRLHRRIAEVLELAYGPSAEAHLAELAFHFVQAAQVRTGESSDPETAPAAPKAVDYSRRAGDHAARSLAYEEAARLYRMALAVLELGEVRDEQGRAETLLALGDVQARAGELDRARETFLRAAGVARQLGSGHLLARAALGFGGRHQWARAGHDTQLVPLLRDALDQLGSTDDRLRARLLTRLACAWRSEPDRRSDSAALSQEAIDIARSLGEPATLSFALAGRFWATWWPENPEERQQIEREMMVIAEAVGDGERIVEAHLMRFLSLTELGQMPEARQEAITLSRVVEALRQPAQLWLEPVNRAELALLDGEFSLAEELVAREVDSGFRVTAGRDDVSAARMHRFLLRREQGRLAEEEATVRESARIFPWYPMHRAALVCVLLDLGRRDEAQAVFDELAAGEFRAIYRDNEWLLGMSMASECAALLGDAGAARILYEQLLPFAGRHAIGHAEGSVGAVDRYLGLLAATLGNLDDAEAHLVSAIATLEEMAARPWLAHAQHDLAVVLRQRNAPGDHERANALDRTALATAQSLAMVLVQEIAAEPVGEHGASSVARSPEIGTFRREGDYWTIEFEGDAFRVRDAKGLHHVARLLALPGREIHALDLASSDGQGRASGRPTSADGLAIDDMGDAGPALDSEAKAAYQARLADLREDLAEAEAWNDPERIARNQAEISALTSELASAVGLGGRDRRTASSAERARVSVTRAIRSAMARIAEHSPTLGAHLEATIRTGTYCSYTPDPRAVITWQL
jgi:tetratricopeptide (TPR) repeat protein